MTLCILWIIYGGNKRLRGVGWLFALRWVELAHFQ